MNFKEVVRKFGDIIPENGLKVGPDNHNLFLKRSFKEIIRD
jgi:hypothetical protein